MSKVSSKYRRKFYLIDCLGRTLEEKKKRVSYKFKILIGQLMIAEYVAEH